MKEKLNQLLDQLAQLRHEAFQSQDEKLYGLLGRAMNPLIEARKNFK